MPPVVSRSIVQVGLDYSEYREFLRFDFWYSCAHCSVSEVECMGLGFQIDHFSPQLVGGTAIHDYSNLMWSCEPCNRQKGAAWPSAELQAAGYRFVRPDLDDPNEHYELQGARLIRRTLAGEYSIEVLNLNRKSLRDLRELRDRFGRAKRAIVAGLQALDRIALDRIRPIHRRGYQKAVQSVASQGEQLELEVTRDQVVRVLNHSPLLDPDPDRIAMKRARRDYLDALNARVVTKGELADD